MKVYVICPAGIPALYGGEVDGVFSTLERAEQYMSKTFGDEDIEVEFTTDEDDKNLVWVNDAELGDPIAVISAHVVDEEGE